MMESCLDGLHDADRKTDQTSDKGTHQCDQ